MLQKKVVRLLCGAKRLDHSFRLFYNLCNLKVPDIVELRIGIIMFNACHILLPKNVQQFFSQYECIHATRQNDTFSQKFAHINMKSMSSSVKRVKLWNSLDSSLSLSECSSLKKNYKVKMLNSYVSDMLLFMVKQFKSAYWL